jgi:hypothetical protein
MSIRKELRRWALSYREARTHTLMAACILWFAAAVALAMPGARFITGDLKGGDFIHLYTLGNLAFEGGYPSLEDVDELHSRQTALWPPSRDARYLPVYPPQTALLFAPFASLPFGYALALWMAVTVGLYATIVAIAWRMYRDSYPDARLFAAATAAFPPFWLLVLFGQSTIVPFLGFFLAWLAFRAQRPILAGAAFGLLSIKPQLGILVACVFVLTGQWRVLLGGAISGTLQLMVVVYAMGSSAVLSYAETLIRIPAVGYLLEPSPWRAHSLRALTDLLPSPVGVISWLILCAAATAAVVKTWRVRAPLEARFGLLGIATVLVSPHLFVYDVALLVLPIIWLGAWVERAARSLRVEYWHSVYGLFVFLLVPTARMIYVQVSVLLMAWMFWRIAHRVWTVEAEGNAQKALVIRP